jgi:hypothetical protein
MERPPDVTFVVCANGLGHFRRVLDVATELASRDPGLEITILCASWQHARFAGSEELREIERTACLRWVFGVTDRTVVWPERESSLAESLPTGPNSDLASCAPVREARLVVSDNLVEVLAVRTDAVLMGSFLWSEIICQVYPNSERVRRFAEREQALLASWRPPMLCVADLAMPGVRAHATPVALPWMRRGSRAARSHASRDDSAVAVLVGATGSAHEQAAMSVEALLRSGFSVGLPAPLLAHFERYPKARHFSFDAGEFASYSVALCRAGLGTLHDCVFHAVPMVVLPDANPEIEHNGRRVEELGLGLRADPEPASVVALVQQLTGTEGANVRARMVATPMGGVEAAATWLLSELERRRSPIFRVCKRSDEPSDR